MSHPSPAALSGLKVVDLSQVLAGPLCTMILADLGADVVKIEPPGGDQARHSLGTLIGDDSSAFFAVNRNKRSVMLDLRTVEACTALHRLVSRADVVVENFRPGVAERLGAGYDELSRLNPRLVYGSVTGFGPSGPYADRAGLDLVAQAMSGLMSVTGEEALARVFDLFPRLQERTSQMAGSMSGGEQQMVAIARALMTRPRLLMFDEPSLGLAPVVMTQVFAIIRRLSEEGLTILLVEQNLKKALDAADRGYVVETGSITMQGSVTELIANEDIRSAYLGI